MFSLDDRPYTLCDRISRRELMKIGGLNLLGLSLPTLLAAQSRGATAASSDPTFGRAKNVIYLWLQGGPPQHETFDPKPDAPLEIRGPFKPISTNVPGIQVCELLPRTAAIADKLAVVRSMSTDDNTHDTSGYWVLTGNKYEAGSAREIKPSDWPYFGSVVKMLKPSTRVPALSTVWIPDIMRLNDNVRPAGQTAGFLGAHRWGQCVLLARRLIEAGVRLVHVGWPRDPGDTAVDNPLWDTHAQNANRLQDVLCPMFDVGFTALIEDLDQRGLLQETLVVAVAEFGRTPKINKFGGRDHWGPVFSFVLAGAGIAGGQVYGSSDKTGGYPASNRVQPPELTATIFHLLGIGHDAMFRDRTGRPLQVSKGEPLWKLLGTRPATAERVQPEGNVALVAPYDDRQVHDTDFESATPLEPHGTETRAKTWQASPILTSEQPGELGVMLVKDSINSRNGERHAALGFGVVPGTLSPRGRGQGEGADLKSSHPIAGALRIPQGARAMLTQEVRNPRAGRFTFSIHACGASQSSDFYREVFLKHFVCRLAIFGFLDLKKDHRQHRQFATFDFQPAWCEAGQPKYDRFQVAATLRSQDAGAMETSRGIGVAVIVEKVTPGILELPLDGVPPQAFIRIDDVELAFNPRPRDDNVTV
ncbi:MAG: DUF1501 domain-containing protein [Planctomycetia bacterium]|nr:DUF1501 domain-containing protein [Planctomycetia bacterium]